MDDQPNLTLQAYSVQDPQIDKGPASLSFQKKQLSLRRPDHKPKPANPNAEQWMEKKDKKSENPDHLIPLVKEINHVK